jgi:acyl-CoA thioester hydrolase
MGVVHHPRYLVWFEVARTELLRSLGGSYRDLEDAGTLLMVVEVEVRHRRPARYDDIVTVRTRVDAVGSVRLQFGYEVLRGETLLAEGRTLLAACDREGRPRRFPAAFGALLEATSRGEQGKGAAPSEVQ